MLIIAHFSGGLCWVSAPTWWRGGRGGVGPRTRNTDNWNLIHHYRLKLILEVGKGTFLMTYTCFISVVQFMVPNNLLHKKRQWQLVAIDGTTKIASDPCRATAPTRWRLDPAVTDIIQNKLCTAKGGLDHTAVYICVRPFWPDILVIISLGRYICCCFIQRRGAVVRSLSWAEMPRAQLRQSPLLTQYRISVLRK